MFTVLGQNVSPHGSFLLHIGSFERKRDPSSGYVISFVVCDDSESILGVLQ